jgi:hypothetical protein
MKKYFEEIFIKERLSGIDFLILYTIVYYAQTVSFWIILLAFPAHILSQFITIWYERKFNEPNVN